MRRTVLNFVILWALLAASAAVGAAPTARVIVRFKPDSALLQRQALSVGERHDAQAQGLGQRVGLALRSGAGIDERTQVMFANGIDSAQLAARLARQSGVEYAVVDERRRAAAAPNDPLYLQGPAVTGSSGGPVVGQWYLRAPDATVQSSINIEAAWDVTPGTTDTVVAVLDSGVRFDHADLLRTTQAGGKLLAGYDFISDVEVANDGDGRDADPSDPGDWITQEESDTVGGPFEGCGASNSSWHGTKTAGVIGAITGNGIGMAGVARNVFVLPLRVLGTCGGFDSDIIAAMRWAVGLSVPGVPDNTHPARVLNMSLGSVGACPASYSAALAEVNARGAVVVSSAGNSAGHAVGVPANCPGMIAVGGLRHIGTKVGFSDLGPEIALSAPGGNCVDVAPGSPCLYPILTTSNAGTTQPAPGSSIYTDSFNASFGTSFSAPLVAGTAALMVSARPTLSAQQVRCGLRLSARAFPQTGAPDDPDTGPIQACHQGNGIDQFQCYCTTKTCGAGMLDAGAAVQAAASNSVQACVDVSPVAPAPGATISLSGSGTLLPGGASLTSTTWALLGGGAITSGPSSADALTTTLVATAPGPITVRFSASDGATSSFSDAVIEVPLLARIDASSASPRVGDTVALTAAQSVLPEGRTIAAVNWTLATDGGASGSFTGATDSVATELALQATGTYTVQVAVTDSEGVTASASHVITVSPPTQSGGGGGGAVGIPWLLGLCLALRALRRHV